MNLGPGTKIWFEIFMQVSLKLRVRLLQNSGYCTLSVKDMLLNIIVKLHAMEDYSAILFVVAISSLIIIF